TKLARRPTRSPTSRTAGPRTPPAPAGGTGPPPQTPPHGEHPPGWPGACPGDPGPSPRVQEAEIRAQRLKAISEAIPARACGEQVVAGAAPLSWQGPSPRVRGAGGGHAPPSHLRSEEHT